MLKNKKYETAVYSSLFQRLLTVVLVALIMIEMTGCATMRIATDASPANQSSTPKKINRVFWGIINKKARIVDPIYTNNGIQNLSFHVTGSEAFVSVITLGIYCPINYSYVLALAPRYNRNTRNVSKMRTDTRRKIYDTNTSGCHDTKVFTKTFTHDTVAHKPIVMKRLLWGLINSIDTTYRIPNSSNNGGVEYIDMHVKFWQGIVTFFTAGIYCPVTYTYKFAYLDDEY